jgi:DNA-directed RNA polymerase specialized sigma24 family protein
MHAEPVAVLVNHVRRLVGAAPQRQATDLELLRRFAGRRDEAAFEALVRRHGPMVQRVCRRALPNTADSEDVFQATFLVLARKAASEHWHDSVANWLYGVAHRLARKARENDARRTAHEGRAHVRAPAAASSFDTGDFGLMVSTFLLDFGAVRRLVRCRLG